MALFRWDFVLVSCVFHAIWVVKAVEVGDFQERTDPYRLVGRLTLQTFEPEGDRRQRALAVKIHYRKMECKRICRPNLVDLAGGFA